MSRNPHPLLFLSWMSLYLVGCGQQSHSHSHSTPSAETPSLSCTVWTEKHEFFLEHEVPSVGALVGFALHVSNLADGSPRAEGPLSMSLQTGEQIMRVYLKKPTRAGIYLTELRFPSAGEWQWTLDVAGDQPKLPDITVHANQADVLKASQGAEVESGITVLKEQQWPVRMKVEASRLRKLGERIPATARVIACRTHSARIPAPLAGTLSPPRQTSRIALGQRVVAGDTLAILKIPLLSSDLADWESSLASAKQEQGQAKATLETALAGFTQAKKSAVRVEDLHAKQAKSDKEWEESIYQLASAKGAVQAAESTLQAWSQAVQTLTSDQSGAKHLELELRAPISGVVIFAPTSAGEWLNQGELLFEIQDLSQLHVAVRVPEADLPRLGENPQAHLHHPTTREEIELPGKGGELLLVAPLVHPVTHSAEVLYEIPNPGWLRPGMTLAAHLATGQLHEALAVPISALVDDAGLDVVFVQTAGESFERRAVRLGLRDGDYVEILEGLAVGEQVVVDGAYVVHLVSLSGTIPAHTH